MDDRSFHSVIFKVIARTYGYMLEENERPCPIDSHESN